MKQEHKDLIKKLSVLTVSSCTCGMKTHETVHHSPTCTYRVLTEAIEAIEELQWNSKPIEDAPRDGTQVIVWNGDMRTLSCWEKDSNGQEGWLKLEWPIEGKPQLMRQQPTRFWYLPDFPYTERKND